MTVYEVIDAHIPSLTDADETDIYEVAYNSLFDAANVAIRTCACGERIDGFYEYVSHLKEMLRKEGL